MKVSAKSHSNIAFIKYWGKKDEIKRMPYNDSISMNLDKFFTLVTAETIDGNKDILLSESNLDEKSKKRFEKAVIFLKQQFELDKNFKIKSQNSMDFAAKGVASSASFFSALTKALSFFSKKKLSEKELSIIARQLSGSACRSIPDGFVYWKIADKESFAYSLYDEKYWDIVDVVFIQKNAKKKKISSSKGHSIVLSSIFFKTRIKNINNRISKVLNAIKNKEFKTFGSLIEKEAIEFISVSLTADPVLYYWNYKTWMLFEKIWDIREKANIPVYFTVDAGTTVHAIVEQKNVKTFLDKINEQGLVIDNYESFVCKPSKGASFVKDHLF